MTVIATGLKVGVGLQYVVFHNEINMGVIFMIWKHCLMNIKWSWDQRDTESHMHLYIYKDIYILRIWVHMYVCAYYVEWRVLYVCLGM